MRIGRDVTTCEEKLDALQVTFGCGQVNGSPAVEVAHVHVVAEEHMPEMI